MSNSLPVAALVAGTVLIAGCGSPLPHGSPAAQSPSFPAVADDPGGAQALSAEDRLQRLRVVLARTRSPLRVSWSEGMTLEALAAEHGLSVSAVRDSNPDLDLASLHPGDSLRLPPVEGLVVTVAAGDSLNALATRYSADAGAIAAYNQVDEDSLEKGEELVLPGGHLPPPPPPPTAPSPAPSPAAPATPAPQKAQLAAAHVPPAAPPAASSVQDIIRQAFAPLGPNAVTWALRVAACESGYNPLARNPSGASGLFQFMPSTWASTPQGRAGQSVWDPVANARAAAWYYQTGGPSRWSCR